MLCTWSLSPDISLALMSTSRTGFQLHYTTLKSHSLKAYTQKCVFVWIWWLQNMIARNLWHDSAWWVHHVHFPSWLLNHFLALMFKLHAFRSSDSDWSTPFSQKQVFGPGWPLLNLAIKCLNHLKWKLHICLSWKSDWSESLLCWHLIGSLWPLLCLTIKPVSHFRLEITCFFTLEIWLVRIVTTVLPDWSIFGVQHYYRSATESIIDPNVYVSWLSITNYTFNLWSLTCHRRTPPHSSKFISFDPPYSRGHWIAFNKNRKRWYSETINCCRT